MSFPKLCLLLLLAMVAAAPQGRAQAIIENGNFDDPTDPFKGWITDYTWSGNTWYMGNKKLVTIVTEGGHKNVASLKSPGDAGVKMESKPFPMEPGFRYTANFDVKGGGYRIYFAGYKWKSGVRPHENPELGELQVIYQSKASVSSANGWKPEKIELPGVAALSPQATGILKQVRFLTVYFYFLKDGAVDNVVVTKAPDPRMKF
jgi:hypothetical protein